MILKLDPCKCQIFWGNLIYMHKRNNLSGRFCTPQRFMELNNISPGFSVVLCHNELTNKYLLYTLESKIGIVIWRVVCTILPQLDYIRIVSIPGGFFIII